MTKLIEAGAKQAATRAATDEQVIRMWLHGKSPCTIEAYSRDVERFLAFAGVCLNDLRLEDLQAYADDLEEDDLADSTRARKLAAVKSMLTFAHRIGYVPFNVGKAVPLPKLRDRLVERILTEEQVQRIIALETDERNQALLRLMYVAGLRVSEVTGLSWRDLQERKEGGQITVYGKGGKTRPVLLSPDTWKAVQRLRGAAGDDEAVFESAQGGHLSRMQVYRIVREAALRSGISKNVSPHWLRHAHASHALDRGAAVHLVKETLGHASLATTSKYAHARPDDSSALYLSM